MGNSQQKNQEVHSNINQQIKNDQEKQINQKQQNITKKEQKAQQDTSAQSASPTRSIQQIQQQNQKKVEKDNKYIEKIIDQNIHLINRQKGLINGIQNPQQIKLTDQSALKSNRQMTSESKIKKIQAEQSSVKSQQLNQNYRSQNNLQQVQPVEKKQINNQIQNANEKSLNNKYNDKMYLSTTDINSHRQKKQIKNPIQQSISEKVIKIARLKKKKKQVQRDFVLNCHNVDQFNKLANNKAAFEYQEYNGLDDKYLKNFFMRQSKQKELRRVGVIDQEGYIIPLQDLKKIELLSIKESKLKNPIYFPQIDSKQHQKEKIKQIQQQIFILQKKGSQLSPQSHVTSNKISYDNDKTRNSIQQQYTHLPQIVSRKMSNQHNQELGRNSSINIDDQNAYFDQVNYKNSNKGGHHPYQSRNRQKIDQYNSFN